MPVKSIEARMIATPIMMPMVMSPATLVEMIPGAKATTAMKP